MTEQDWLNSCFAPDGTDLPDADLALAMCAWADFVEERGLGYENGLRSLATQEPRPRFVLAAQPTRWRTGPWESRSSAPFRITVDGQFFRGASRKEFPTPLEAVKAMAFAVQEEARVWALSAR